MKPINLILVDDHQILQHGISQALEQEGEFHVIGKARSGREAVTLAAELNPDIMVMDISMPDMNGMDATRNILEKNPGIRIIALSMHTERTYVMGMLNAGASGYLLKSCSYSELVKALKTVHGGDTYLSPEITRIVIMDAVRPAEDREDALLSQLSPREKQVLKHIAEGLTSKQAAKILNISSKTIDIHRNNIKKKLDIHTIAGLTRLAIAKGLISSDL